MIAAVSDLHITDETTSYNTNPDAFEIFLNEIVSSAKDNNATEVHVILMGDIFDFVRTDYWQSVPWKERPWNWDGDIDLNTAMNPNPKVEYHCTRALNDIFKNDCCKRFINILNSIKPGLYDSNIDVDITYLIGNHDRMINNFNSLQGLIEGKLRDDKTNINHITFTNSFYDIDYTLLCRHGHAWDNLCYGYDLYLAMNDVTENDIERFNEKIYKVQTIGEVITAELMSGLIYNLNHSHRIDSQLVNKLKEVNNLRPMLSVFKWIPWFTQNLGTGEKNAIIDALASAIGNLVNTSLSESWKNYKISNIVTLLGFLKSIIGGIFNYDALAKIVNILPSGKVTDNLYDNVSTEYSNNTFKNLQYVLYGILMKQGMILFPAGTMAL